MTEAYLGQLFSFAGNFAIKGTAMCNGQLLPIQQNTALFSLLGTYYGGNGVQTFALPGLQSRRFNSQGQGTGLSFYDIGQIGGNETGQALLNNLPSHNHTITGSLGASATTTASGQVPGAGSVLGATTDLNTAKNSKPAIYTPSGASTANVALAGLNASAAPTGSNQPFSVVTPYLAITMLIYLVGIYPTRN